jgi:hypothetical protein
MKERKNKASHVAGMFKHNRNTPIQSINLSRLKEGKITVFPHWQGGEEVDFIIWKCPTADRCPS